MKIVEYGKVLRFNDFPDFISFQQKTTVLFMKDTKHYSNNNEQIYIRRTLNRTRWVCTKEEHPKIHENYLRYLHYIIILDKCLIIQTTYL